MQPMPSLSICPSHLPFASALRICPLHLPLASALCTCPSHLPFHLSFGTLYHKHSYNKSLLVLLRHKTRVMCQTLLTHPSHSPVSQAKTGPTLKTHSGRGKVRGKEARKKNSQVKGKQTREMTHLWSSRCMCRGPVIAQMLTSQMTES